MLELTRFNPRGLVYKLVELPDRKTQVNYLDKQIIVNAPIVTMNQAWYNWTMAGQYIQKAFNFLSADEREFILTGITKAEWDQLFPDNGE